LIDCVGFATSDQQTREEIVRQALKLLGTVDFNQSPPQMAQRVHQLIRILSKNSDPYLEHKKKFNDFAMSLYPELKARIANSSDRIESAIRIAIAGNIIDFGIELKLDHDQVIDAIDSAFLADLDKSTVEQFKKDFFSSRSVLMLGDNTGEIVFDKLLVEELGPERITYVVKGSPILNDSTIEDAREVGMDKIVRVIDNGQDLPGTVLQDCPQRFQDEFNKADLVISKGQGNYETLNEVGKKIYFMLKAKCPVVARHLGVKKGTCVFIKQDRNG
jgi:uncharacterized protein with ATP-grasp and redox domains